MILKVQRPIFTNTGINYWLFYNVSRSFQCQLPESNICKELKKAMRNDYKCFIEAHVYDGKETIDFVKRVRDRDW